MPVELLEGIYCETSEQEVLSFNDSSSTQKTNYALVMIHLHDIVLKD